MLAEFVEEVWRGFVRAYARETEKQLRPRQPEPPGVEPIKEDGMKTVYQLSLPPATDDDVVGWELREFQNGTEQPIAAVTDGQELKYEQDLIEVRLSVRQIDAGGRKSDWSEELIFDPADEFAPTVPGAPGITPLREEE
jgi:hypothetical protein